MNIYLLKSEEVKQETYENILNFFKQFSGPLNFKSVEEISVYENIEYTIDDKESGFVNLIAHNNFDLATHTIERVRTWEGIFDICKEARKKLVIGDNEFVIFLTDHLNELNWFLGGDDQLNGFVHTAGWDSYFPNTDVRFPVAYQVVSLLLKQMLVDDFEELGNILHQNPKGCLMDFCQQKKEIIHKMRTADVCTECLMKIEKRGVPRNIIIQMFNIMNGVRDNILFKARYQLIQQPSKLSIEGRQKKIFLTDFGNLEIRLTPLEKTMYLLFINHPNGLEMNSLTEYRQKVYSIYAALSNQSSREAIEASVLKLIDPLGNSASEKIAKIKRKFIDALGEKMAEPYIIYGPNGGLKKIELDRNLVSIK